MEVGIGIHGEPGRRREALGTAAQIADVMVEAVVSRPRARRAARGAAVRQRRWAARRCSSSTCSTARSSAGCARAGLEPARRLVGPYITSLEMAGASLTLLELDDELAAAVGCSRPHRRAPLGGVELARDRPPWTDVAVSRRLDDRIAAAIEAEADHLTQLDSAIGDGDHGVNMTRGLRRRDRRAGRRGRRPARASC